MTNSRRRPKRTVTIEEVTSPARIRKVSLARAFPEIAVEWYYKKNCGWGPEDFNYSSNVKVWWQCPNDKSHIYAATITNRTGRKSGCMVCNVGVSTDLSDYPDVLAQFNYQKNKGVDPHKLPWHNKEVHWKCPKGPDHEWTSSFNRRLGERCPFCTNEQLSVTNSLATIPKLAQLLHPTKNGKLKAEDLCIGEKRLVWWKCPEGPDHEWQALITTKVHGSEGCPFCNNKLISVTNSLAGQYPEIAKEWHSKLNKPLKAKDVNAHSAVRYWWKCTRGHEWQQSPVIRTKRGLGGCRECRKFEARVSE